MCAILQAALNQALPGTGERLPRPSLLYSVTHFMCTCVHYGFGLFLLLLHSCRVLQREVLLLELSLFMVSHGNVQEAVDVLSRYSMAGTRGHE